MLTSDDLAKIDGFWFAFPRRRKKAIAHLRGSPLYPQIRGSVIFTDVPGGTEVSVHVSGLPPYQPAPPGGDPIGPHGFHIHVFGNCQIGDPAMPFLAAEENWNPDNQPHGNHAGDFPVLFSNNGKATMHFFTNRFRVWEILGRSVLIHENPDDYRTQPGGDSGRRIACGVIQPSPFL